MTTDDETTHIDCCVKSGTVVVLLFNNYDDRTLQYLLKYIIGIASLIITRAAATQQNHYVTPVVATIVPKSEKQ